MSFFLLISRASVETVSYTFISNIHTNETQRETREEKTEKPNIFTQVLYIVCLWKIVVLKNGMKTKGKNSVQTQALSIPLT